MVLEQQQFRGAFRSRLIDQRLNRIVGAVPVRTGLPRHSRASRIRPNSTHNLINADDAGHDSLLNRRQRLDAIERAKYILQIQLHFTQEFASNLAKRERS